MSDPVAAPPPPRKARTKRLSCPGCGGSIEVRANGISVSAICASCGRTIDVANDELRVIAEGQRNTRTLDIAIGTRGIVAGTEWEVVGYQARSNPDEGWTWDEYLLFNPYRGFRFLAHDDEGWTLYCMLRQDVPDPAHVTGDRRRYSGPEASQARTDYVLGEFYWRVRVGDMAQVEQYIAAPYLLVKETTGDEIIWSRGLQVPTDQVRTGFKLSPPPKAASVPDERQHTTMVLRTAVIACILLVLLYTIGFGASRSSLVYQHDYVVAASGRNKVSASDPFTVPDRGGNLRLDVSTQLQNDWLGLTLSLVGEGGTPVFNASTTVEYYSGYDSDGSWTDGSQSARIMFRSIPGGVYRLLVEADAGSLGNSALSAPTTINSLIPGLQTLVSPSAAPEPSVGFSIQARRHAPAPEWFWFALLLILPYPLYRLFFKRRRSR